MTLWRTVKMNVSISYCCCSPLGRSMNLNNVVSDLSVNSWTSVSVSERNHRLSFEHRKSGIVQSHPDTIDNHRADLQWGKGLLLRLWLLNRDGPDAPLQERLHGSRSSISSVSEKGSATDSTRSYRTWLIFNSLRSNPIIVYQIEFSQSL